MTQSICPECLKYTEIGEENAVGFSDEENVYKCTSCEEVFDLDDNRRGFQSGEISLDWIQTHKSFIEEVGEDNIFRSISAKIKAKKENIMHRGWSTNISFYEIDDPEINRILNSSFLDFSCLLLYGKRYKQIIKMDESWVRDMELNKLLGIEDNENDL